jgi:crotonobetainyl-CoA:carnitine CoA-transferase CaiB-like acyl-CoA transferase
MMSHEQTVSLEMYERVSHPLYRAMPYSRLPLRFEDEPADADSHAPLFGQHNRYVFGDLLGLSEDEIRDLYEHGVTADRPNMA